MVEEIVSFELTQKQTELLNHFFGQNEKEIGMIIGQFLEAKDGKGYVHVGYVNNRQAKELQRAMGVKVGKLTPSKVGVYVAME